MDHTSLVQKQLEAYNQKNLELFCSYYHSNVVIKNIKTSKIISQGISNFRSHYKNVFESNPNQYCHLKSRIVLLECIVDEELITGRDAHQNGLHEVAIYYFSEGLISHVCLV